MEQEHRGCVYFFRHIGLTPVKIGYSTHESPISRFEQFKTFAPYGSELIGFIRTYEAKELETILHERFSAFRLGGEWFDITQDQCESVISFYSNIEDIKEKNEFQIEWAKAIEIKNNKIINETLTDSELVVMKNLFEDDGHIFKYNENILNKDFLDHINNKIGYNMHIKTAKIMLKKYCNARGLYIYDTINMNYRGFKICVI